MGLTRGEASSLLFCSAAVPACAQVRVWEGTLTLPVYEEGNPDPNPPFDQQATTRFNYPYTLRNELTGERRNHACAPSISKTNI